MTGAEAQWVAGEQGAQSPIAQESCMAESQPTKAGEYERPTTVLARA